MRGVAALIRQPFFNGVALFIASAGLGACSAAPAPNLVAQTGRSVTADSTYDVVIVNGKVVDGSGNPWFFGDVAIRGDRVVRVVRRGMLGNTPARRRIDATGKIVAPGFIDIQAGGPYLAGDGRDVSKLVQGVTTEIMGEGYTSAPISDLSLADLAASGPAAVASAKRFQGPHGFDAWLRAMEAHGVSPNVGAFVGASTLREYGMGLHMGAATGAPLDSMRVALRNAMEDGAFGLGSALIYPPGNFASTEELIEVAKAMAPYGGLYITHMRSEADQVLEGIDEALRIGREAGVPVDIYHLKAAGIKNWPKLPAMIAKIDSARTAGLDVQATMYPYTAGGTGLAACLPPFASADGKLMQNLADPAARARIRAEVAHPTSYWESLCEYASPEGVLLGGMRSPETSRRSSNSPGSSSEPTLREWIRTAHEAERTPAPMAPTAASSASTCETSMSFRWRMRFAR
jgi:dihydroorotase/N-acyl-D-amino-acid deacylase